MKLKLARAVPLFLIAINAGLTIGAVQIWRDGETRVHAVEHLAAHDMSLPDLTVLTPVRVSTVDIATIRDKAMFYSRRSFYEPPPPSQSIPSPEYDFAGSMDLSQGKRIAFVKTKSDHTSRMLHLGDDLDGWRVDAIEPTRVVLARDDHRTELASAASSIVGLVHGPAIAPVAPAGPHVLGSQATSYPLPARPLTAARTYRPPPPP